MTMNKGTWAVIAVLVLTAAGLGGLYWYQQKGRQPPVTLGPAPAPAAEVPASQSAAATPPPVRHPIDPALAASAPPVPASTDPNAAWRAALGELTSPSAVLRFLQPDDFARRFVVTLDNLARPHAAPALWPVNPAPGRFSVSGEGESQTIAPTNAGRYAPLVSTLAAIDTRRAAALYTKMYPQLQKAYEEAGYPGRYLNDRVVEVIDHLLATPEPEGPIVITLTEVKGEVQSAQPWLRYEFADPALQGLSSGQKMLLRVGPEHRRTLKNKMAEARALITRTPPSR